MRNRKALVAAVITAVIFVASILSNVVNVIELPENAEKIRKRAAPVLERLAPYMGPRDWVLLGTTLLLAAYGFDIHGRIWRAYRSRSKFAAAADRSILVRAPTHQYSFVWDPPEESQMITRPRLNPGEHEPLGTRNPVFWMKNLGPEVPGEITITWRITGVQVTPDEMFLSSTRIKMFNPHRGEHGGICWETQRPGPPPMRQVTCVGTATEVTAKIDFPAPGRENDKFFPVAIPDQLWSAIEIYVVASIYGLTGFPSVVIPLEVSAKWTTPKRGETKTEFHCIFRKMGSGGPAPGQVQLHPSSLLLEGAFNIEPMRIH